MRSACSGADDRVMSHIRITIYDQCQELSLTSSKRNRPREFEVTFCVRGVISPLLANLYLHLLDRKWERRRLEVRLGARIVRYADDIVILCGKGSEKPMEMLRYVLDRLGLTLNETKTKVVNAREGKFDFLGFTIWMGKSRRTGRQYPHAQPSKKSVQAIKDRVTALTKRERTPVPLEEIVELVNTTVRGWVGYFHFKMISILSFGPL